MATQRPEVKETVLVFGRKSFYVRHLATTKSKIRFTDAKKRFHVLIYDIQIYRRGPTC